MNKNGFKVSSSRRGNFRVDKDAKICEILDLVWTDTFTLLRVTFDSRMERMEANYDEKYNKEED